MKIFNLVSDYVFCPSKTVHSIGIGFQAKVREKKQLLDNKTYFNII